MPRMNAPLECIFCVPDPCTCQGTTSTRARKAAPKPIKKAAPVPAPVVEPDAPTAPVAEPPKAGLRNIKTLATVIPRPKQIQSAQPRAALPKADPKPTGRADEMTAAIARFALGGLIDKAELRRHRGELLLSDEQYTTLEEEVDRRNGP